MERICPNCKSKVFYKTYKAFWKARKNDSTCRSCFYESLRGVTRSETTKKKIGRANSKSLLGNIPSNKGVPMSVEQKEKCRLAHLGKALSPAHVHKIMLGNDKSRFRKKSYTFPNGETVLIQGYENLTLDKLISENIDPSQIKTRSQDKPVIQYELDGKKHRYYPDCLVSPKTLIETKSLYTWEKELRENIAKMNASLQCGYDFRLLVWDSKRQLLVDKTQGGVQ